jgi:hypothetical protein
VRPARQEEQGSGEDCDDDDQENYGSRHRPFRLVMGSRGFCPTFGAAV